MRILVISGGYPNKDFTTYPFVKQLVEEWSRQGHDCTVIAPYSITKYKKLHQFATIEKNENNKYVTVLRPNFLSLSTLRFGKFCPSEWLRKRAIEKALNSIKYKPDVIYCHFWNQGIFAYNYAKKNNIPLFVATGESSIADMTPEPPAGFNDYIKGVICVSSKNKTESIELGLTAEEKCIVIPNAVNSNLFCKLDKQTCRKKLNISHNVFVAIFVGWFNERKGVLRVAEAIKHIKGESVYSIFVGSGDLDPKCENIIFKGRLLHEQIPLYLNAADVFVLPTLHEGCCNAVVEAMACGLPIISSNLPFNWDVLNENNSIMIDPNNIDDISDSIMKLRDDNSLREKLSLGALKEAHDLTINLRAKKIIDFMRSRMKDRVCNSMITITYN